MNSIKNFFATFNISTHSISAAILGFVGMYLTVPALKDLVDTTLNSHKSLAALFAAGLGVALKYSGSHSTQGQVQLIADTPAQKVATAVTAVKAASAPPAPATPDLQNVVAAAAAKDVPPKT